MALFLIERGADIHACNPVGSSTLFYAAKLGDLEIMERLIRGGLDVKKVNNRGYTPIHFAAAGGSGKAVQMLLDQGANINSQNKHGDTALHQAAYDGHLEAARILMTNGADINPEGVYGPPLHLAVLHGKFKMVKFLVAQGAVMNIIDAKGRSIWEFTEYYPEIHHFLTSLNRAAAKGDLERVQSTFKKYPLMLNTPDSNGQTPLHHAVLKNHRKVAEYLIKQGADVNACSKSEGVNLIKGLAGQVFILKAGRLKKRNNNWTPLHFAVANNGRKMVELLIARGADAAVKDVKGYSPLDYARLRDYQRMVEILEKKRLADK